MAILTKEEFIKTFLMIIKNVLEQEIKLENADEQEMINEAYYIVYKKLRHIRTGQ